MKYIKTIFLFIYLTFIMTSCHNEYDLFGETEQYIQFNASPIATKGTPLQFNDPLPNIGVFGYNTGIGNDGKWKGTESPIYIQHLLVTYTDKNWKPNTQYSWPKEVNANATFFAYSPYTNAQNGITVNAPGADIKKIVGIPTINYTVPSTCENQPDLMVSVLKKDLTVVKDGKNPVSFEMHHALTSIGFKGTGVGLIDKLTINGVKTTGTLTTDESGNATWGNLSGNGALNVKTNIGVTLGNESKDLNTNDGYLMMIPQDLQSDAKLTVTLVGGKIIEFPLKGKWEAGQQIFYEINLFDLKLTNGYTIPNTFVGAFWKNNQIGERIIRIPFEKIPQAKRSGKWKAFVLCKDDKWKNDDILFSTDPSQDYGITWNDNEYPANMNQYDKHFIVNGSNYTGVEGTMNTSKPIYFRMGIKTYYSPTDDRPARYAIVAIVYEQEGGYNYHFIYLRQGENPDYIMRPNENGNDFSDTPSRANARKFAVYNLTGNIDSKINLNKKASFTEYPSQSGALFQWANFQDNYGSYQNYAFNPSYGSTYDTWPINIKLTRDPRYSFWYYYGQHFNISPLGFKRPQDGYIDRSVISTDYSSAIESYDVNNEISSSYSEFKQSLMAKLNKETDNTVFGYYADGFFDRRAIDPNSCVAGGTAQVASIGKLFYNPKTYASLFFPTAGYREGQNGQLTSGSIARYWSSCGYLSASYMHRGLSMEMSSSKANFMLNYRSSACNIRCVAGNESFYRNTNTTRWRN